MATYKSNVVLNDDAVFKPFPRGQVGFRFAEFEATSALVLNDVIEMVPVYAGETVLGVTLITDDLDTGTTLTLNVGDGVDVDRYIAATTIGRTGGVAQFGDGLDTAAEVANLPFVYTQDDTIDVRVPAAPTGGGTGTVKLVVLIG